jgi:hypothetical protein
MMKSAELKRLKSLQGNCGYNDANKREFKRLGMKMMRELRTALGIEADVRYNAGGIAVSGECTLHGDSIYVQISADYSYGILYRTCNGRKDYSGGPNHWFPVENLETPFNKGFETFVDHVRYVMPRKAA